MTITFRPGIRENVGLWINLIGGTGSGKTRTGMRLASGIASGKPFAVIDTENRRALHYADDFKFEHAQLRPPFRPDAYAEAVLAADAAGYPVVMIDSGSHVWSGDGGMLDWQDEELDEMVKRAAQRGDKRQEWQIRESGKMSAWIKPKKSHKHMVEKLLQVKAHIIMCLRAEPKIEMVKGKDGKTEIRAKESLVGLNGWIPICDKNLPFEATASFLFMADHPGIPLPIKLQEQHKKLFPLDKQITEESGRLIAQWAAGTAAVPINQPQKENDSAAGKAGADTAPAVAYITQEQAANIETLALDNKISAKALAKAAGAEFVTKIPANEYQKTLDRITAMVERRGQA